MSNKTKRWLSLNPRKVLLLDGIGALFSAFLLGIVLVRYQHLIGMSEKVLYILAFFPIVFAVYDFICLLFCKNDKLNFYVKIIALANLSYCVISAILLIIHFPALTLLGIIYFVIEIIIVAFIAYLEWNIAGTREPAIL
jgi:hypothetical protein